MKLIVGGAMFTAGVAAKVASYLPGSDALGIDKAAEIWMGAGKDAMGSGLDLTADAWKFPSAQAVLGAPGRIKDPIQKAMLAEMVEMNHTIGKANLGYAS